MNAKNDAYLDITRLQASYADIVTRRAWTELPALFDPAATIRVDTVDRPLVELTGPAELTAFLERAMPRFEFLEFVILNSVITVDPGADTAQARLYIAEERVERDSDTWSTAFGLYRDRYARRDGRWVFAARSYRSLARRESGTRLAVFGL